MTEARKPISDAAMDADLGIVFPGLWRRPLCEYGDKWRGRRGFWTGLDADMPDGEPMCCAFAGLDDGYDGMVHEGFMSWLAQRGWCCEHWDGDTFFLMPSRGAQIVEVA